MRGHIQQRGSNTWRVFLSLGWNQEKGRYDKLTFTVHGTKQDAEQALVRKLAALGRGPIPNASRITVAEYLEYWLAEHVSSLRPKTQRWYTQIVRNHVMRSALGRIKLSRLSPLDIQRYLREIGKLNADGEPTGERPAANTVHAHYRTLHAAFASAVAWNMLDWNPVERVAPPKKEKHRAKALKPEEAAKLLAEAEKRGRYALYLTAITQGLRIGEVLALKWDDIDFEAGTMRVDETLQRGGPNPVFGPVKTESGERILKMPEHLQAVLQAHRAEQAKARLALGPEWCELGLVFTTWRGTAIAPRNLHRQFKGMLKAVGLPTSLRPHDLRHTSATLLIKSHVPIKTVSARLGHSGTGITLDLYGHVLDEMEDEAAATMDTLFPRPTGTKTKKAQQS